jgi:hypothetical protein
MVGELPGLSATASHTAATQLEEQFMSLAAASN